MKINQKVTYLFSGVLIGLWMSVLFVKSSFDIMTTGLSEAGNANWDNLKMEILDQIGILMLGLGILSAIYLLIVGILYLASNKKLA